MKTIKHKGNVYQVGKPYMDENGNIGILMPSDGESFRIYMGADIWQCNVLSVFESGTIEADELKLEDGKWYMTVHGNVFLVEDGMYRNQSGGSPIAPTDSFAALCEMVKAES